MICFPMCQDDPEESINILSRRCKLYTAFTILRLLLWHSMLELPAPHSTLCFFQREANNHIPLLKYDMVNG